MTYTPPLEDINFLLNDVLKIDDLLQLESYRDLTPDLINAILEEAGKFAQEKLAPLNVSGDQEGCSKAHDHIIETPKGFKQAYSEFIANGWNSVPFLPKEGGQGLPWVVSTAISELWSGANMAFALCPLLTQGAVELLSQHGNENQKNIYLKKMVSGEWTGTMCLTESQAGSDVGAVKTSAKKNDNHYLIKGQKIFITFGDHDFTDNIIHMVLARTPDAPEGSKGISLFIVPKILEDGSLNDVRAISIEHKLGIHGSPTAVLAFGDNDNCIGYLVGEENQGLKYMFTMMNNARLAVGVEGVAISENSYQKALAYANERVQGGQAIANYPDVQRMLLTIRAKTDAMRALSLYTAKSIDLARINNSQQHNGIVNILIPVLKSYATDMGFEMSSMAMQIFGGIGYVEETGIAQNIRDSRIAMIYEGTNGIQAMDLVSRKITVEEGKYYQDLRTDIQSLYQDSAYSSQITEAFNKLDNATQYMQNLVTNKDKKAGLIAAYYLNMFAITIGGALMSACHNAARSNADTNKFHQEKLDTVKFYMQYILPEINTYEAQITNDL